MPLALPVPASPNRLEPRFSPPSNFLQCTSPRCYFPSDIDHEDAHGAAAQTELGATASQRQDISRRTRIVFVVGIFNQWTSAEDLPSKEAESIACRTADGEFQKLLKLNHQEMHDKYKCELSFFSSLQDQTNDWKLSDKDQKGLQPVLGDSSFFLIRFTNLSRKSDMLEIFISEDGTKVLWKRRKA
ncbi:MAG: hypothetical protein K8T25_13140 [Planctomycetia bacterium]|nr:hypothetical protein [Planctomycetia bacterium]